MSWFPSAGRAAPISTSMMVDGPGTIGLHPWGRNNVEGGRRQLFWLAMQSRRRRKKAGGGRCRFKIEATLSSPVFGQTKPIEDARGSGLKRTVRGNRDLAMAIGGTLSRFAPHTAISAPSRTDPNLNGKTMMS